MNLKFKMCLAKQFLCFRFSQNCLYPKPKNEKLNASDILYLIILYQ